VRDQPGRMEDKFLPAGMFGKLLNIAGELSENKKIDSARFKEIVCGETITGQHKNGQPFDFQPQCAHWFSSNHAPKSDDSDDGFARRWLFFTFNKRLAKEGRIDDYEDVLLEAEREEIAAWAVRAIPRLMETTYTKLPSSDQVEERVNQSINSVHYFLKACSRILVGEKTHQELGVPAEKALTKQGDLYTEYQSFCLSTVAVRPATLTTFRERMDALASLLDFQIHLRNSERGLQEIVYEFITIADRRAPAR
jgi:putative DNA primase/helicase